jgi:hypothetical protein
MPDEEYEFEPTEDEYGEFVPAVLARSSEDAEKYRELLEDHDIPVVLSDDEEKPAEGDETPTRRRRGMSRGITVMVPDALLDEASEIIADREDTEEFEQDDEDFDDDEDDDEAEEFGLDGEPIEEEDDDEEDLFGGLDDLDDDLDDEDDDSL